MVGFPGKAIFFQTWILHANSQIGVLFSLEIIKIAQLGIKQLSLNQLINFIGIKYGIPLAISQSSSCRNLVFVKDAILYITSRGHERRRRENVNTSAKHEAKRSKHYCK